MTRYLSHDPIIGPVLILVLACVGGVILALTAATARPIDQGGLYLGLAVAAVSGGLAVHAAHRSGQASDRRSQTAILGSYRTVTA